VDIRIFHFSFFIIHVQMEMQSKIAHLGAIDCVPIMLVARGSSRTKRVRRAGGVGGTVEPSRWLTKFAVSW